MNVISLDAERNKRVRRIVQALDTLLLHGPITDPVILAALEELTDAELEAFYRARARAQLERLK